jgi:hypothetical protein
MWAMSSSSLRLKRPKAADDEVITFIGKINPSIEANGVHAGSEGSCFGR